MITFSRSRRDPGRDRGQLPQHAHPPTLTLDSQRPLVPRRRALRVPSGTIRIFRWASLCAVQWRVRGGVVVPRGVLVTSRAALRGREHVLPERERHAHAGFCWVLHIPLRLAGSVPTIPTSALLVCQAHFHAVRAGLVLPQLRGSVRRARRERVDKLPRGPAATRHAALLGGHRAGPVPAAVLGVRLLARRA